MLARHSWENISRKAISLGLKRPKRASRTSRVVTMDFSKVDTEAKAYFLGLISADGCITKNLRGMEITLHESDREILDIMRKEMFPDGEVKSITRNAGTDHERKHCRLRIFSTEFVQQLALYNLGPSKSLTLQPPPDGSISDELMYHYIRGLFDGDGDITYDKRSPTTAGVKFRIVGSCDHIIWVANWLESNGGVVAGRCSVHETKKAICELVIVGSAALVVFEKLYNNASIYLTRKFNRYKEIAIKPSGKTLNMWLPEEEALLRKLWFDMSLSMQDIVSHFEGRSFHSVKDKGSSTMKLPSRQLLKKKSKEEPPPPKELPPVPAVL